MRGKMKGFIKTGSFLILLSLAVTVMLSAGASAQDVVLRAGDRVDLTVPQRGELDRTLLIDQQGVVTIPIVGNVAIGGMTVDEAEIVLLRALRDIYPSVRGVELNLLGEESRRTIYVQGEVLNPGRFGFEKNPTVWEAIREAGGATASAALDVVRVVRAEGDTQRTFLVNLKAAIESGKLDELPLLQPGDAVIVSQSTVVQAGTGSVKVIGAVAAPGPYQLPGDKTLIDAILAAGGTSDNANLKKVMVIRTMPDGAQLTLLFNFKRYLDEGDIRHNPLLLPNDTVHVQPEASGLAVFKDPRFWLAVVTAYAAVYAILQ